MMLGSMSRRNQKPPGKVCAEAGATAAEAEPAIASAVTIVFTNPSPQWSWPDLFRPSTSFLRLIPKKNVYARDKREHDEKKSDRGITRKPPIRPCPALHLCL